MHQLGELKSNKLIFGVLLLAGISFTLYFQRILVIEENNWKCTKKAADNLNIHLGIIHSFLHGVNSEFQSFIPISPFFANEKLLLSFLPDFYIAGLVSQGLKLFIISRLQTFLFTLQKSPGNSKGH